MSGLTTSSLIVPNWFTRVWFGTFTLGPLTTRPEGASGHDHRERRRVLRGDDAPGSRFRCHARRQSDWQRSTTADEREGEQALVTEGRGRPPASGANRRACRVATAASRGLRWPRTRAAPPPTPPAPASPRQ